MIFVSAAELSADIYASLLVSQLHLKSFGVGGDNLRKAGTEIILPMEEFQIGGLFEIIHKLPELKRKLSFLTKEILRRKPSLLLLVDFPDLHLRLAKKVKSKLKIPVVHYISPTVWAWREGRMKTIKSLIDLELLIYPFEEDIYRKWKVPYKFIGHPLFEIVKPEMGEEKFRRKYRLEGDFIIVLPGSRPQELKYHMGILREFSRIFKEKHKIELLLLVAPSVKKEIEKYDIGNFILLFENKYSAMAYSKMVLSASGTANLEAAILERPLVVFYRLSPITFLFKPIVKLRNYSIVNILSGKEIARELIQRELTPENLLKETEKLLFDQGKREKMKEEFRRIKTLFPKASASSIAAKTISSLL